MHQRMSITCKRVLTDTHALSSLFILLPTVIKSHRNYSFGQSFQHTCRRTEPFFQMLASTQTHTHKPCIWLLSVKHIVINNLYAATTTTTNQLWKIIIILIFCIFFAINCRELSKTIGTRALNSWTVSLRLVMVVLHIRYYVRLLIAYEYGTSWMCMIIIV